MTDAESSQRIAQKAATHGIETVTALAVGFAVLAVWVLFVFPVVGELATGTPSWQIVHTAESPWWGSIFQFVALAAAWLSSVVSGLVAGRAAATRIEAFAGWNDVA